MSVRAKTAALILAADSAEDDEEIESILRDTEELPIPSQIEILRRLCRRLQSLIPQDSNDN